MRQYLQRKGQPLNATKVVTPSPSVVRRWRLMPKIFAVFIGKPKVMSIHRLSLENHSYSVFLSSGRKVNTMPNCTCIPLRFIGEKKPITLLVVK